jgi:tetratricopeptide (TPR) repeat protein
MGFFIVIVGGFIIYFLFIKKGESGTTILNHRKEIHKFVQQHGGMVKLYQEIVDYFIGEDFEIREVTKDYIYLHNGTSKGKVGVEILQVEVKIAQITVGVETAHGLVDQHNIMLTTIDSFDEIINSISNYLTNNYLKPRKTGNQVEASSKIPYSSKDNHLLKSEAEKLYKAGRFSLAAKYYYEVVENEPTKVFPVIQLANCFLAKGDYEEALFITEIALTRDIKDYRIYSFRAEVELKRGNLEEAFDEILKAKNYSEGSDGKINEVYDDCLEKMLTEVHHGKTAITMVKPLNNKNMVYLEFSEKLKGDIENRIIPLYLPKVQKLSMRATLSDISTYLPELEVSASKVLEYRDSINVKEGFEVPLIFRHSYFLKSRSFK